jgi:hypothetical protein
MDNGLIPKDKYKKTYHGYQKTFHVHKVILRFLELDSEQVYDSFNGNFFQTQYAVILGDHLPKVYSTQAAFLEVI